MSENFIEQLAVHYIDKKYDISQMTAEEYVKLVRDVIQQIKNVPAEEMSWGSLKVD